jgi:hypothetical protein
MVVNNNRGLIGASQCAAESQDFAEKWGGRLVCCWVRSWVDGRKLPVSLRGRHVKVFTSLSDPAICTELQSYVQSNKWSMNREKLAEFSQNKLVPEVAAKYAHHVTNTEMPQGLKKYLEVELLPRIHLKAGKGVSLCTAHRWLYRDGFKFTEHKKSLYFDGHERHEVVDYRQKVFLPPWQSTKDSWLSIHLKMLRSWWTRSRVIMLKEFLSLWLMTRVRLQQMTLRAKHGFSMVSMQ